MRAFAILLAAVLLPFSAFADQSYTGSGGLKLDVPYVPTSEQAVQRMLQMGNAGPNDIHYDLGSGDGRIVVAAARDFKVKKGTGVDLDPERIAEANANAQKAGVSDRVTFVKGDLFAMDFRDATLLTMYLLPDVNMKLRPKILDTLKPGTRVVSHAFTMGDWGADKQEVVGTSNLYLWIVPAKVAGTWTWNMDGATYRMTLAQAYQAVNGNLTAGSETAPLTGVVLSGADLKFNASMPGRGQPRTLTFAGKANGDTMVATVDIDGRAREISAKRTTVGQTATRN
jgi:hypothetical protein